MKKINLILFVSQVFIFISCENKAEKELVIATKRINELQDSLKYISRYKDQLVESNSFLKKKLKTFEPGNKNSQESFEYFLIKFSEDKDFQKSRIIFPIKVDEYILGEPYRLDTLKIDNWDTDKYEFHPEGFAIYDNKQMRLRNTNFRMVRWFAYEACGDLQFHFKNIKGKWFLYYVYHDG